VKDWNTEFDLGLDEKVNMIEEQGIKSMITLN